MDVTDSHTTVRETKRRATFIRSASVGILATLVDLLMLGCLVELCGLAPVWANVPALITGLAVQFFGNKLFAFGDRSKAYVRQGGQFVLVEVGALALSGLAFHLAVSFLNAPYALARIACGGLVYVSYSYPLWRLIFRPRGQRWGRLELMTGRTGGGAQCSTHS